MLKAITGTKDILPEEVTRWHYVENIVRDTFRAFNYSEIRTPVFEETSLFARGIGESTDIVGKEMYTFADKGGTSLTLRPEMTASVVRAFIEHSLSAKQTLNKLFYIASMFRQERPQAGRQRQFNQFGAEALGSGSPALDSEMILMAYSILNGLGLKNLSVKVNSIGIPESREKYKLILKEYLADKLELLSEESRKRYYTNVLRIFDSKDDGDGKVMLNAPLLLNYLDDESIAHFDFVKNILEKAGVPYCVDPALVRGLDYYTKTTFEIVSSSVGSQSALCGGGRYDLLAGQLGGKDAPGVGFAAGIERILLACENENCLPDTSAKLDVYIVRLDKDITDKVFELAHYFRRENLSVEFDYLDRSVKAQMREANKLNARFTILLGGSEYQEGNLVVKHMSDGEQEMIPVNMKAEILSKIKGV
jgi:histidyl-tRNA synthetase